jgi:hypothetical protein
LTYQGIAFAVCVLTAALQPAKAQAINVSDVNQEAKNAYQESCSLTSNTVVRSCQFPAMPPGKRLAIRWLSGTCSIAASRVSGVQLIHELSDSTNQAGAVTRFRTSAFQSFGNTGERVLAEPLYAHADSAPRLDLFLRDDASNGIAVCSFSLRGYLVNK